MALFLAVLTGGAIAEGKLLRQVLEENDWKLNSWTAGVVPRDAGITASFQGMNLTGNTGCNRYSTRYNVEEENLAVSLDFEVTAGTCGDVSKSDREKQFLLALKGVRFFALTPQGNLQLVYRLVDGWGILTFSPLSR